MTLKLSVLGIALATLPMIGVTLYDQATGQSALPRQALVLPEIVHPVIAGKPVRVTAPTVGLDLPLTDGIYNPADDSWTLSPTTGHYAIATPLANDTAGNTFIYGHNTMAVFRKIMNIKPGDEIVITTDNNKRFRYVYRDSFDVDPSYVTAIKHDGPAKLTIQTCVGRFYEQRRMFQFDFVRVD